ncbi:4Fe-4S binding protein [Psychroflexus aestuariivivens]|uniref:4Fe-4S binding protein n=1 Tax=Psychroflexus aestuariivivens TaxID=1795040 RepID=UPI000FDCC421|nr:4Fe-4S dicluster domain-containing protein [Psychroflexus aestuariivivens]
MSVDVNMSVTGDSAENLSLQQKLSTALGLIGLFIMTLSAFNIGFQPKVLWMTLSLVLISVGIIWYAKDLYAGKPEGIKNDRIYFKSLTNRGFWAYVLGLVFTGFYIVLYFYPSLLGLNKDGENTGVIALFDPLSKALSGNPASQWFVYGTLYTLAILGFGIKFLWKYRHSRYHILRTFSVMFFQLSFAFIIPEVMARLNSDNFSLPYYNLVNIWPLNYYNFEQYRVDEFISAGAVGIALLIFGVASILVITPILTYKYGKRWYCSWVCGCGGLAETAGDPFRHLSDKSQNAWKLERWLVHSVVVFVVIMTTAVVHSYLKTDQYWLSGSTFLISVGVLLSLIFAWVMIFKREQIQKDAKYAAIGFFVLIIALIVLHFSGMIDNIFLLEAETLRSSYGFAIGAIFSGVVGVGFYPIFGNRVWCRFGCPMAAILGFQQRLFSKFRITTNGGQCISCGNCSTYCEMGIDVRAYAQKGENIIRSSCVGCGVCSSVCPRGVLKLENDSRDGRINSKEILLGNDVDLMDLVNQK